MLVLLTNSMLILLTTVAFAHEREAHMARAARPAAQGERAAEGESID